MDTGARFALFVPSDPDHSTARDWFDRNTGPLLTTDYVVDELMTLFKMRGEYSRALEVGPRLFGGEVCSLEWVTRADVLNAWTVFSTYKDKGRSFTACVSQTVMARPVSARQ